MRSTFFQRLLLTILRMSRTCSPFSSPRLKALYNLCWISIKFFTFLLRQQPILGTRYYSGSWNGTVRGKGKSIFWDKQSSETSRKWRWWVFVIYSMGGKRGKLLGSDSVPSLVMCLDCPNEHLYHWYGSGQYSLVPFASSSSLFSLSHSL